MGEIRDPIYGLINFNEDEIKLLNTNIFQRLRKIRQLATLLHDIGHGPFSHVSESILEKYVTDAMIKRGIELGIEKDGIDFLGKLYKYNNNSEYLENYLTFWDERVVDKLINDYKDTRAGVIFDTVKKKGDMKVKLEKEITEIL